MTFNNELCGVAFVILLWFQRGRSKDKTTILLIVLTSIHAYEPILTPDLIGSIESIFYNVRNIQHHYFQGSSI